MKFDKYKNPSVCAAKEQTRYAISGVALIEHDTGAMVPSCSAEQIQAERDSVARWAEQVAGLIGAAPSSAPRLFVDLRRGNRDEFDVAQVVREADARAWDRMLRESGLWSFMDQTAREQWREQIEGPRYNGGPESPSLPAFTVQAAEDMARQVHADRGRIAVAVVIGGPVAFFMWWTS
jgi:hypothetical protein